MFFLKNEFFLKDVQRIQIGLWGMEKPRINSQGPLNEYLTHSKV